VLGNDFTLSTGRQKFSLFFNIVDQIKKLQGGIRGGCFLFDQWHIINLSIQIQVHFNMLSVL
jgi:hypothetical protein